jgi:beta-lactamase class A
VKTSLAFLLAVAAFAADPSLARLQAEMTRLAQVAGGRTGAAAIHLETGRRVALNGGEMFPLASTYKVPIAVRLLDLVDGAQVRLDQMVAIEPSDLHPGSGTLTDLFNKPGLALSVRNLLELMLLISDNSATDVLLRLAGGGPAVTARMIELGFDSLRVDRPTIEMIRASSASRRAGKPFFDSDPQDSAAPEQFAELLGMIHRRALHQPETAAMFVDILRRCRTGEARLKGLLPAGTVVMHKTGTIAQSANDAGIIQLPGDAGHVALAVFVKSSPREPAQRERGIAEIARAVHDYFTFFPLAQPNHARLAARILASLAPARGEKVYFGGDPSLFPELRAELRGRLYEQGCPPTATLDEASIYLDLPRAKALPEAAQQALRDWTDRGGPRRQLHFHWSAGSVGASGLSTEHPPAYDALYESAIDIDYAKLSARLKAAAGQIASGLITVKTPAGTDLRFRTADRPFNLQDGDASAARVQSARVRVDRDIELPAGVLRVAPIETSVEGTLVLPDGRRLRIRRGRVLNPQKDLPSDFREFGLGFNDKLAAAPGAAVLPYFGYGAGVVRLSLGDNTELGGAVKSGARRWFFFPDATVTIENKELVKNGRLLD